MIPILILAAGTSSRMGKPKQLLPLGKTTLLGLAINNALLSDAYDVYCVLGANINLIKKEIDKHSIKIIFNKDFKKGLSSSIAVGIERLEEIDANATLIMLADQPDLTSEYLNEMIDLYENNHDKIIATEYNSSFGVPIIFPKKYFNELKRLKGDQGARQILHKYEDHIIIANRDKYLIDIDTPEVYKAIFNIKE